MIYFCNEKISNGYFYEVYDIGNSRVFKKQKSFLNTVKQFEHSGFFLKYIHAYVHNKNCIKVTKRIKENLKNLPVAKLGNPVFKNGADYEQEKVVLLMDYFETHSLEENKTVIDTYMNLVVEFLKYGIHDSVYKFKNSYGVNTNGEVIWIDFNEVCFSKNEVLKLAQNKKWQNEAQFRKYPDSELKQYVELKFNQTLTQETVNQYWSTEY